MINNHIDVVFAYGAHDHIWRGIGTVLLEENGAIGDAFSRAEGIIKSRLGWSLLGTLRSKGPMQGFMLQPMSTAVQLALTAAWVNRGIKPTAALSRCGGEFAAVHAGGGLSFEDALDLACRVGSLIREGRGRGKMLHVRLSESETKDLRDACRARFAVISDAPNNSTIIACDATDAEIVTDFLSKQQVEHFLFNSGFAPHCWIAESWKEEMLRPLQQNFTACSIPIYSATSQGRLASGVDWTLHFWRVVREPLSIRAAVRSALDDGFRCFLDVGGHPILRNFILNEARARNLNVDSFATMEWRRPLHEVMNPTQAALTAAAPRQLESLHSPWPRPASPEAAVTSIRIDKADPYPVYARLRRMGPVFRANWRGLGSACWVVPRYQDALTVFKDPRFVRNPVNCGRPAHHSPIRGFGRDLVELDPPDHTRLRKLVSKAFTPQMVQRFDRRVTQLAGQILDGAKSRGEIELISEYASVIPITVISELLGVPIDDIGKFRSFIYSLTFQIPGRSDSELEAAKLRFANFLRAVFAARRGAPRDDLVTSLAYVEQDSDRLSPDELIGMVYLLLLAGFVTTVNLIGNGMLALLRHPEQLKMLRQNPALADAAIEELLRFDSPVEISSICFTSTELDLSGVRIPRGAPVRVLIASANRDEDQFSTPDTLDITRRPCPHLSFGQGSHYCLGASLARLEGRIAVNTLIERAPNLRLPDPSYIKWAPHPVLRGLQQLPLRF